MVATVAVASPLLVSLSLPAFAAERGSASLPVALSLLLAVLLCSFIPLALLRPGTPDRRWLLLAAATYSVLVALERVQLRDAMPPAFTPWLVTIACVAFSCLAIGTPRAERSSALCGLIVVSLGLVYADRMPGMHLVIDALGLAALAAGLIVGTRALRRRADRADAARHMAEQSFIHLRRQAAMDAERSRTDALLHDSVLATLLEATLAEVEPRRLMASTASALEIVSRSYESEEGRRVALPFHRVLAATDREFAPFRERVQLDFTAAHHIELPVIVAETLISATLQALTNSINHAGTSAHRTAVASPTTTGGVKIIIRDDGAGFDLQQIAPERLGVRVSIIERMTQILGAADVHSSPGNGTVVELEWNPAHITHAADSRSAVHA